MAPRSSIRLVVVLALLALVIAPAIVRTFQQPNLPTPIVTKGEVSIDCDEKFDTKVPTNGPGMFVDISDEMGIHFQHIVGPLGTFFMPEINGTGGAMFDFDSDGDLDILLIQAGRSPKARGEFPPQTQVGHHLYRQESDGRFTDVSAASGLKHEYFGVGCAIGDVDNDGDPDVYVTNYGPDQLFINQGDGKFEDITLASGIDNPKWGTCASFFDYDRDGRLDLFVSNYTSDRFYGHSVGCGFSEGRVSYCGPKKFAPENCVLFHNEGIQTDESGQQRVKFQDVTEASGIGALFAAGFGVVCADFTNDGLPDVFVTNDESPNRLWVNRGDGTFGDEAIVRGAALNKDGMVEAGMGLAVGDVENDGDLDLLSTHLTTETSTLFVNDGEGSFVDQTRVAGLEVTRKHTGWGAAMVDLDLDGDVDFPLVNGLVVPCHLNFAPHGEEEILMKPIEVADAEEYWRTYFDANQLLLNDGTGSFRDVSEAAGDFASHAGSGRALITGDIDNDGDVDLLVTYCGHRARLYRNDAIRAGNWLMVRTIDPRLNRDAYGAIVTVIVGEKRLVRLVQPASSYLASHDVRAHFGLGIAKDYAEIQIHWPDGLRERFLGGKADRILVLQRGTGEIIIERTSQHVNNLSEDSQPECL